MNINLMELDHVYQEQQWYGKLLKSKLKCLIPTKFISKQITKKLLTLFIQPYNHSPQSDSQQQNNSSLQCTPNIGFQSNQLEKQKIKQQVSNFIKSLNTPLYLKIGEKSAKDLWKGQHNILMLKIYNFDDLINILQFSEYLTQYLSEIQKNPKNKENIYISLRQYKDRLQHQSDQYRVYVKNKQILGICQKYPHHLSTPIKSIKSMIIENSNQILKALNLQNGIIELYQHPKGKWFILGIQPFYVCGLSLFKQEQLSNHLKSKEEQQKWEPLFKTIETQQQLKEEDMRRYTAEKEFEDLENIREWMQFLNKK